ERRAGRSEVRRRTAADNEGVLGERRVFDEKRFREMRGHGLRRGRLSQLDERVRGGLKKAWARVSRILTPGSI
ncbi:MAG: hypothetical protein AAGU11_12035, partial [Syntrophobacteraceae bacterium]